MKKATLTGLEPATTGSTVRYSNQLSYSATDLRRSMTAWVTLPVGVPTGQNRNIFGISPTSIALSLQLFDIFPRN